MNNTNNLLMIIARQLTIANQMKLADISHSPLSSFLLDAIEVWNSAIKFDIDMVTGMIKNGGSGDV